ncbi:MAG: aspartate--tRNA ligase [Oscillospiraceae bacterium]|jgi:aspartyl-tRNA synthetase|nr:aspartate--tRNA ligase [Oscillospiraceae bacterium]
MAEAMGAMRRTHYCTALTEQDAGKQVIVAGFAQRQRDKGSLIFIDLRDRSGILQLTFDDATERAVFDKAKTVRSEYVLMAEGIVRLRESVNPDIPTGRIELYVTGLKILAEAQTPPFHIGDDNVGDEIALKYRYLDLRNPRMQENLYRRHRIAQVTRQYFYENGFWEIETPMFMKSTPEGARDYLVPSRIHAGKFYALPQSPQIYKQLLMVSGMERYIQLARCFRDEDLRADRQPEFTQIDMEMSFVDVEDILQMAEGWVQQLMKEIMGMELPMPLPRLTYRESMERYGTDKPDTRYGMEIQDLSELVKGWAFPVFAGALEAGGSVRAIVAKNAASALTRKEIDKLTEHARGIGAKGLAYVRWVEDAPSCSFGKFLEEGQLDALLNALSCEKGDVVLIAADKDKVALPVLGQLRGIAAKKLDIIPEGYNFLWITEFPFFEYDEEAQSYTAMHHPFTMPLDECLDQLFTDPAAVRAKCYDLVLNGVELCSGSMRITDYALQQKMFEALGLTDEEIEAKFGFLVNAYRYGAPPHGGMAIGLDRISMILCGAESLRDVTAFPKVQNASELMSECPSPVDPSQLEELHIRLLEEAGKER